MSAWLAKGSLRQYKKPSAFAIKPKGSLITHADMDVRAPSGLLSNPLICSTNINLPDISRHLALYFLFILLYFYGTIKAHV
jgi:hypothetical protein